MKNLAYILILILFSNCNTLKINKETLYNKEQFIDLVINDFIKTREFKKGKVFSLIATERDKVFSVLIIESSDIKYLYSANKKASEQKLPNRNFIYNDKMIYWSEKNEAVDEEDVKLFKKYNLLQDDEGGFILVTENTIDESKKGTTYNFCIDKPFINKKVISNKSLYYHNFKCE